MGGGGGGNPNQTVIRDVPYWLQAPAYGLLNEWFQFYAPGTTWSRDPSSGQFNFDLGTPRTYGGPDLPQVPISPTTSHARAMGIEQAKGGNPYSSMAQGFVGDNLGGPMDNLATQNLAYTMGGPLAGAARVGMLEQLSGTNQHFSEQALLDAMYGHTANRADESIYNMLMGDRALSRQGAYDTQYGRVANAARGQDLATIRGDYLSPESNPFLKEQYNAAASAMVDQYRDAVAPSTAAQFAQAGSFGGSAYENTEAQQRYGLGRNLSELAANMYGANYETERGRQDSATARERGFSENMLSQELARQYQAAENAIGRRQEAGIHGQAGYRDLLARQYGIQTDSANAQQQRATSMLPYLPQLRAADYIDINALRQIGQDIDETNYQNSLIGYQNDLNKWEYQENILRYLAQGLAPMIQATGFQKSYGVEPNNLDPRNSAKGFTGGPAGGYGSGGGSKGM